MRFMNEFDLDRARARFGRGSTPNRLALVLVVDNLRDWTDNYSRSDGWTYWQAPRRSAAKAVDLIDSTTNAENDRQEREDITEAEMLTAVRPIKSFLTKHKVPADHRERILRAVTV